MRVFAVLMFLNAFQVNEAIASVSFASSSLEVERRSLEVQKERVAASMTYESAVQIIRTSKHAAADLLAMIQANIGAAKKKHHHKKSHKSLRKDLHRTSPGGVPPGAAGNSQSDYNGGVWNALYKINDMLLETVEKADLEEIRCASYKRSAEVLMEEIKEDLALYIVLLTEAGADKNAAEAQISEHKDAGDKVEDELVNFLKEIRGELSSLNVQLKVAEGDSAVMEKILNMSECADKSDDTSATLVQTQADLLQCVNTHTGKSYTKLHIKSESLRQQFAQMQHPKVMQLLEAQGIRVDQIDMELDKSASFVQTSPDCGCSCHNDTALKVMFGTEQRNNTCNDRDSNQFEFLDNCCIKPGGVMPCCPPPTLSPAQQAAIGAERVHASAQVDEAMQNEKCSLKDSNKCPELRERFLNIAGGIDDTVTQLEHLIASTEFRKDEGVRIMRAEIAYHKEVGDSATEKLGRAMANLDTVTENQRMKQNLLTTTENEYNAEVQKCKTTLEELANEECALGKIRGELLNMDALPNNVTDCLVSKWIEEECSLTCGGGTQRLTRTIEIEADLGYHCPALEAMQSCNEPRCPLDCELSDWTGWSACSAYCDGGVMDRIRPVVQRPTSGGQPCETDDDSQNCNVQACDKDCVLHDWTEWTASCTKVCGGGRQMRFKHVKVHEFGDDGKCPEFHDPERFQWKMCNTHTCEYDDRYPMTCESKLDVIIAMDASGSMGAAGWSAVKKATSNVVEAMGSGIKVGALAFSSPYWYYELRWCMGWSTPSWWKEFYFKGHSDCGIEWAHHISEDVNAVKHAVESATADFHGTLTNIAIDKAGVELRNHGRDYAQSILIVFTDGYPESREKTRASSATFKDTGRIIYVPVGNFASDEYFQEVSSYPWQDNLVNVDDFRSLAARSTLDRLMPNFCPNIVQNVPQEYVMEEQSVPLR